MDVIERKCRPKLSSSSKEGQKLHSYYLLDSPDWCHIIPVTEHGKIVFIKQHRIGINALTLEVPGGIHDPEDRSLEETALRELREETGYIALPGAECRYLGWTHPNPAIMNNRSHSFIIGPVRKEQSQSLSSESAGETGDIEEEIETVEIPLNEVPKRIANGEITHALMLNAFFFLLTKNPEAQKQLLKELLRFQSL